jgi:hypothetical protein
MRILREMRTDSDRFRSLPSWDKWLARYTYEGLDRWPTREIIDRLLALYPNDKEMTLLRGLNFDTKEQYDTFMASIQDNVIDCQGITSWSPDRETAWEFTNTKKTYFPSYEIMKNDRDAINAGEKVRGYRGVLLKTTIAPNTGIDVNVSHLGHESEVILPSGQYKVEVILNKTFKDQFQDGDLVLSRIFKEIKSRDHLQGDTWEYITRSQISSLTQAQKTKILKLMTAEARDVIEHVKAFDKSDKLFRDPRSVMFDGVAYFGYDRLFFHYNEVGLFPENSEQAVKKVAVLILRRFFDFADRYPDYFLEANGMSELAKIAGKNQELTKRINQRVAGKYKDANSRENLQKIKTERDIAEFKAGIKVLFDQISAV